MQKFIVRVHAFIYTIGDKVAALILNLKKIIKSTFSDKLSSGTFIDIKRGYYVVEYVTWLCNRWPILGSAAFFWYRLRYRHVQSNVVSDRNILFFLFVCFPLSVRWSSRWNQHLNQYRLMLCNLRNESVIIQSLDSRFYTKNWESIPMYDILWLWSAIRWLCVSIYVSLFCSLIKKNRDSVKDVYHRGKGGGVKTS